MITYKNIIIESIFVKIGKLVVEHYKIRQQINALRELRLKEIKRVGFDEGLPGEFDEGLCVRERKEFEAFFDKKTVEIGKRANKSRSIKNKITYLIKSLI